MTDTYLGGIYVCSSCQVRLSQCLCDQIDDGWERNRYAVWVERFIYDHPIILTTPSFIHITPEDL